MISSKVSDIQKPTGGAGHGGNREDQCPKCKSSMVLRPAQPYPVWIQIVFGASFVAFMLFFERFQDRPEILWAWSGIQVILGYLLVRGRLRARHRVYRCVRCTGDLR